VCSERAGNCAKISSFFDVSLFIFALEIKENGLFSRTREQGEGGGWNRLELVGKGWKTCGAAVRILNFEF
jgi:hypothetical protein